MFFTFTSQHPENKQNFSRHSVCLGNRSGNCVGAFVSRPTLQSERFCASVMRNRGRDLVAGPGPRSVDCGQAGSQTGPSRRDPLTAQDRRPMRRPPAHNRPWPSRAPSDRCWPAKARRNAVHRPNVAAPAETPRSPPLPPLRTPDMTTHSSDGRHTAFVEPPA